MVELASLNMFLKGLFMYVGTDCSCLDERTDLNNVVATIMHVKSAALFMHDRMKK